MAIHKPLLILKAFFWSKADANFSFEVVIVMATCRSDKLVFWALIAVFDVDPAEGLTRKQEHFHGLNFR